MVAKPGIGTAAIAIVAIIVIAGVGVFVIGNDRSQSDVSSEPVVISTSLTSSTISVRVVTVSATQTATASSNSTTSQECYAGDIPANSSASSPSTIVLNVTQRFQSWSWPYMSSFSVGSYSFLVTNPGANPTPGYQQLEPQLFFNVTNYQGQTERTDVTDLGGWDGQTWPPDFPTGIQTLFGGGLTMQWLFPCGSEQVFLVIMAA